MFGLIKFWINLAEIFVFRNFVRPDVGLFTIKALELVWKRVESCFVGLKSTILLLDLVAFPVVISIELYYYLLCLWIY